jgi:hypothetical protein
MRIQSVTAHAFGPLRGETLNLADGMTVVVGDNESAKSTWHAAIYAALCGRRRGRGRPPAEQRFADLHRPWDHDAWLVSGRVVLDDGRRIELRQDLAGKVDCSATDVDLNRDVSAEIMYGGSPDGSHWLGLDRASFVATACIGQSQLLGVLGEAGDLQEHLQRAAATAGTDETTAAALKCLEAFQSERVGTERANSTRPLQRAKQACRSAEQGLAQAQSAHEDYLDRAKRVEDLRVAAAAAAERVQAHEAVAAAGNAHRLVSRAEHASRLYAIYGDTPPPTISDDESLAQRVAEALATWRSAPQRPKTAPDRKSERLQHELDSLPPPPVGDLEEHPSVTHAVTRVRRAQAQLELHDTVRPPHRTPAVADVNASDDELLTLARTLETPVPCGPVAPEMPLQPARSTDAGRQRRIVTAVSLIAGALAAVIGVLLVMAARPTVGISVVVIGAAILIAGAVGLQQRRPRSGDANDLADAATVLEAARARAADADRARGQAMARCRELGLAADPALLRRIPPERVQAGHLQRWVQGSDELDRELIAAAGELAKALARRGHTTDGVDAPRLLAAAEQYRDNCRARAKQASRARRREDMTNQLAAIKDSEARDARDVQQRNHAAQLVIAAARECALPTHTSEQSAGALDQWSQRRAVQLQTLSNAQREWADLQALLEGRSVGELTLAADKAAKKAADLSQPLDPTLIASVDEIVAEHDLPARRATAADAQTQADTAAGELRNLAATIGSVAAAYETLEAANRDKDLVLELQETLNLTRTYLQSAQDHVHRDIALVLTTTVRRWLPLVTRGRYTDVRVDSTTLRVDVCESGGRWRVADRLSYGTAEQIYLLLRVALADHLTKGHDSCPLLLDDVTVHADSVRTREILDLLLHLSTERQVVVFTQEEQVEEWAHSHLSGPEHAIRKLDPVELDAENTKNVRNAKKRQAELAARRRWVRHAVRGEEPSLGHISATDRLDRTRAREVPTLCGKRLDRQWCEWGSQAPGGQPTPEGWCACTDCLEHLKTCPVPDPRV